MDKVNPLRPNRLKEIGFRICEHPFCECQAFPGSSIILKYCLTCAASLTQGEWKGGFGVDHYINYTLLERYNKIEAFEFFIKQRPESRAFGAV